RYTPAWPPGDLQRQDLHRAYEVKLLDRRNDNDRGAAALEEALAGNNRLRGAGHCFAHYASQTVDRTRAKRRIGAKRLGLGRIVLLQLAKMAHLGYLKKPQQRE